MLIDEGSKGACGYDDEQQTDHEQDNHGGSSTYSMWSEGFAR